MTPPKLPMFGAAIGAGVAIKRLAPAAGVGQADAIAVRGFGVKLQTTATGGSLAAEAQKGEHRLRVVVDDDPAEAFRLAVARVQRRASRDRAD